jgi:hypothetical protein
MQTITFYSYKGGVGRSLVLANVAFYLARFGQKVVALDLDLEAPGLHYKLLSRQTEEGRLPRGIVDYLDAFITEGQIPEDIRDYLISVPLRESVAGTIHLMPAGQAPLPDYWRKLSRLNLHDIFYREGAPGIPLFLELKERIREAYNPNFLLVDARTGITEIGGVATTVLPEQVVCLLLNNRENLEGARSVLRGLLQAPRPPGAVRRIQIVPVLSRLPTTEDTDVDREVADTVRDFLNKPAPRLDQTLDLDAPLILHVDRQLEHKERVLIASPEDHGGSLLLMDYLALFSRLIPADVLQPQVGAAIEQAKSALFNDPDGAERELENLAELSGRPEAYRALLQLYYVRNTGNGQKVLSAAQRLWRLTGDSAEALIYDAVRQHFKVFYAWTKDKSPSLTFVEDVWKRSGAADIELGMKLASSYENMREYDRVEEILLQITENPGVDDKTLARAVSMLTRAQKLDVAEALIGRVREEHPDSTEILLAWAELWLSMKSPSRVPMKLLQDLEQVAHKDPGVALELASRAGEVSLAEKIADRVLEEGLRRGPSEVLEKVGAWFYAHGRREEFRERIAGRLGRDEQMFLGYVERRARDFDEGSRI